MANQVKISANHAVQELFFENYSGDEVKAIEIQQNRRTREHQQNDKTTPRNTTITERRYIEHIRK